MMQLPISKKEAIEVALHGHAWKVYPMKCRNKTLYRVVHRVNGERRPKNFSSLADAKADAKNIIKEIYTQGDSKIHLAADEKLDWQAAMNVLKRAGIRSSLETICRQYADLCAAAGGAGLLTDIVRKNVSSGPARHTPIQLGRLKDIFISTMESEGRSTRYVQVLKSYCGTFVREIGPDTMTDQITREMIQEFLNDRKVGPRGKLNFARAIRVMSFFGKRLRCLPEDWSEIDHLTLPLVKDGNVLTYSPDDLKRLLAASPDTFIPCLALAAFAGMRSAEIERIGWDNIRLVTQNDTDRVINLEAGITKTNSRRTISIHETLAQWLNPHTRPHQPVWPGSHSLFYRLQQQTAKDAGIQWKQNALRHTCISACVAIDKNVPRVAYESGNSTSIIKQHYLQLMPPSTAEAWFSITPIVVHRYKAEQEKQQSEQK
jgi:integrase